MRDNASLTRPAWIEADLARDLPRRDVRRLHRLWLLIHASRFGARRHAGLGCAARALARGRAQAGDRRARPAARWRRGRRCASLARGSSTREPGDPRPRIGGDAGRHDRAVRAAAARRLPADLPRRRGGPRPAPPAAAPDSARGELYADGYSFGLSARALRTTGGVRRAPRRVGGDEGHAGQRWRRGRRCSACPRSAGCSRADGTPMLDAARIPNRSFCRRSIRLGFITRESRARPVNWRDMETEELGTVYESLLELRPRLGDDGAASRFASGEPRATRARPPAATTRPTAWCRRCSTARSTRCWSERRRTAARTRCSTSR